MRKLSTVEWLIIVLAAAFAAFAAGWFLRGAQTAAPVEVAVAQPTVGVVSAPVVSAVQPGQGGLTENGGLVNINTADSQTLQTLPGIGEKRAADIIAYRQAHGPFRRLSDLTRVDGIGEGTLENLRGLITLE